MLLCDTYCHYYRHNCHNYSNDEQSNELNVCAQDAAKRDVCQPLTLHIVPGVVCIASLQFMLNIYAAHNVNILGTVKILYISPAIRMHQMDENFNHTLNA